MSELPVDVRRALESAVDTARPALGEGCRPGDLADHIYAAWYGAPVARLDPVPDLPGDLVSVLRAAHAGSERWEDGWAVQYAGGDGRIVAARNGERRLLDRCDYIVPVRPGIVASAGALVRVPARRDHIGAEGAWWYAHSEGWRLDSPDGELVRIYWNVGPEAAVSLVRQLSLLLLDCGAPWMLKAAVVRDAYCRADAVVLFLPRAALDRLRQPLDDVRFSLVDVLRAGAPPLTFRVAQGVAIADDPSTGESFGEHRCRLIAEGILAAERSEGVLPAIAECFREAGVPLERPYVADAARRLPWE